MLDWAQSDKADSIVEPIGTPEVICLMLLRLLFDRLVGRGKDQYDVGDELINIAHRSSLEHTMLQ